MNPVMSFTASCLWGSDYDNVASTRDLIASAQADFCAREILVKFDTIHDLSFQVSRIDRRSLVQYSIHAKYLVENCPVSNTRLDSKDPRHRYLYQEATFLEN